eukprot:1537980-Pyramimonas_sp.AAC.1
MRAALTRRSQFEKEPSSHLKAVANFVGEIPQAPTHNHWDSNVAHERDYCVQTNQTAPEQRSWHFHTPTHSGCCGLAVFNRATTPFLGLQQRGST